jgi:predicted RNA-binding Zn-ribbon protein involved in translation (DUF1610 family)
MASREEENDPKPSPPGSEQARALIYLPCPACGRAVQLSDENRVHGEPDTYVCPNCGNRFVLDDSKN